AIVLSGIDGLESGIDGLESGIDGLESGIDGLESDIEQSKVDVQDDLGAIEHHWHSRWRVYPQDVTSSITIAATAVANTFGDWTLIVPLNTVPFRFDIIGIVVEEADTTLTTYFVQLGYNTINAEPGTNMEIGERRFRIAETPIKNASEILQIRSQESPANSTVWGRLKASGGASEEVELSVVLGRHVEVEREVPLWPAFPW
ncbi:unnamed protein product, partial [marine sediment metagenome]